MLCGVFSVYTVIFYLCNRASTYYLPGFSPTNYMQGVRIDMKVRKMQSVLTQTDKRYYELNFCKSNNTLISEGNLGEALARDYLEPSDYLVCV